jgi:hypothetical protein
MGRQSPRWFAAQWWLIFRSGNSPLFFSPAATDAFISAILSSLIFRSRRKPENHRRFSPLQAGLRVSWACYQEIVTAICPLSRAALPPALSSSSRPAQDLAFSSAPFSWETASSFGAVHKAEKFRR